MKSRKLAWNLPIAIGIVSYALASASFLNHGWHREPTLPDPPDYSQPLFADPLSSESESAIEMDELVS